MLVLLPDICTNSGMGYDKKARGDISSKGFQGSEIGDQELPLVAAARTGYPILNR